MSPHSCMKALLTLTLTLALALTLTLTAHAFGLSAPKAVQLKTKYFNPNPNPNLGSVSRHLKRQSCLMQAGSGTLPFIEPQGAGITSDLGYKSTTSGKKDPSLTSLPLIEPFGKGVMQDIRRKLPAYPSDLRDGMSIKCVSSIVFLFFVCLAPCLAFGSSLSASTAGQMGIVETVLGTSIAGMAYALFAGQPLTIIGTTGPLLTFMRVLQIACVQYSQPFLPVFAWVGLWTSFLLGLSACTSLSNMTKYFTKFTDEAFGMLISLIFIFEGCMAILGNFLSKSVTPLDAFYSLFVSLATVMVAKTLAKTKRTPFFNKPTREIVTDFAPVMGVAAGIAASVFLWARYGAVLPTINVPAAIGTTTGRPWLVDLWQVPPLIRLACAIPGIMASVLLFMDQNITVRIVMAAKNPIKKGHGIHLDMLVLSAILGVFAFFGLPWVCAATLPSLLHLRSLAKSDIDKAGIYHMTQIREQRITGFAIHALIGASVLLGRNWLGKIPNAVLTGFLFYLGISSLGATELFARTKLFITDPAYLPEVSWVRKVDLNKTKLFTAIQLACVGAMWWLKSSPFGVLFPVVIGILAPVRIVIEKLGLFTRREMEILDEPLEV